MRTSLGAGRRKVRRGQSRSVLAELRTHSTHRWRLRPCSSIDRLRRATNGRCRRSQSLTGRRLPGLNLLSVPSIGGPNATVTYCGAAAGLAGLFQIDGKIPEGVASGNSVPVQVTSEPRRARFSPTGSQAVPVFSHPPSRGISRYLPVWSDSSSGDAAAPPPTEPL
jgi:hypothetical protein